MLEHEKIELSSKKRKTRLSKSQIHQMKKRKEDLNECKFHLLTSDSLEHIACYLDTKSALALMRTSKTVRDKLMPCVRFWKSLCKNENFHEYTALKTEDKEDEPERLSWSGEKFHEVDLPSDATMWNKIFLRGMQMRRNICSGRYELWRLFMTDKDNLPVKKMTEATTFRDLRTSHRRSPFNNPRRRVRIHRYWNEDYLVAIQHTMNHSFNDIFVWGWRECQNPRFLYSYNMSSLYPTGLFPTAFFLWKKYLVLMPDTGYIREERQLSSMIRVHDLADNMALTGSYDFPENGMKRHIRISVGNEAAHLHKIGDKAVALCRVPNLMFFIFSLPNCDLLHQVSLPVDPERPLELDDLDQRFLMRDNTMMFMFHHPDFFNHLFNAVEGQPIEKKYGRLLLVDFDKFLKDGGPVSMRLDSKFDCNEDYIEKISVISKTKMACAMMSGRIVVRNIIETSDTTASFVDRLSIACPEPLQEEFDSLVDEEVDTDGPNLCTSRSGDIILILRHFVSGRKIHAYNDEGNVLYAVDIDSPQLGLERQPGYVSIDMDGNFVCAADQDKVVVWNSRTGRHVNTIKIPTHYNVKEDPEELRDKFCWKGHTDFAFAEDGIIVIHSQRNFPVAADVMLFW